MTVVEAITGCLRRYAGVAGRAGRREFWFFTLFAWAAGCAAWLAGGRLGALAVGMALLIPGLTVGARRMHDLGRPAIWFLIGLVPVIGWIAWLLLTCAPGEPGPNRYGSPPPRLTGKDARSGWRRARPEGRDW